MKIIAESHAPFLFILVGMSLLDYSRGWSLSQVGGQHCRASKRSGVLFSTPSGENEPSAEAIAVTRRDAVSRTLTTLIGGVTASTALLSSSATTPFAHADVTNKVASSPALRALTRAQEKLPTKLLPDVQANDFVAVKARFREPPFDMIRKNGQILVLGGEDGPDAKKLVSGYKALITAIEKLDGTASLGARGRSIGPLQMTQEYEDIVAALDSFLKVGAEAAEIPLQQQPSMQDNLRTGSIETKVLTGE